MSTAAAESAGDSKDFLGMSDEDFLKINGPGGEISPEAQATSDAGDEGTDQQETAGSAASTGETETNSNQETVDGTDGSGDTVVDSAGSDGKAKPAETVAEKPVVEAQGKVEPKADPAAKAAAGKTEEPKKDETQPAAEADKPVDYEAFYKQILTPFKANGRTIELKTPEEAIRLMQMGAGYGRKIQDLQPHLKVIRMLEKNNLLDEGRLSLLIDVNSKNPDAIKKIIKESGIDPLDLNINDNVDYIPKNHSVSDKEMAFQTALSEVQDHPTGIETLRIINQTWDQESKSVLLESPQLVGLIQTQRDNGIYDQIVAEVERQKLLGKIPHSTPFLQAYKAAGDHLQASNGFKRPVVQEAQIQTQPEATQQPQVIATRTAAPKAQVQNGDRASAAAPTKTTNSRKAGVTINPLEMADDDFLKQFKGRL